MGMTSSVLPFIAPNAPSAPPARHPGAQPRVVLQDPVRPGQVTGARSAGKSV